MATWRDVRGIALSLPGASEDRKPGRNVAWIVGGRFFAWDRPLRKPDLVALGHKAPSGPILGIRTDGLEMKEALLAHDPRIFFTTPHFDGYPAVLVRLQTISVKKLREVIVEAWLARALPRVAAEFSSPRPKRPRRLPVRTRSSGQ